MAEYIWIDATGGVRSKSKVSHNSFSLRWNTPLSDFSLLSRSRRDLHCACAHPHTDHEPTRAHPSTKRTRNTGAEPRRAKHGQSAIMTIESCKPHHHNNKMPQNIVSTTAAAAILGLPIRHGNFSLFADSPPHPHPTLWLQAIFTLSTVHPPALR